MLAIEFLVFSEDFDAPNILALVGEVHTYAGDPFVVCHCYFSFNPVTGRMPIVHKTPL